MENIILELKNIKKYFPIQKGLLKRTVGYIKAVDGVDLFVKKNQVVGIVGESGCGKSTLARCILRLYSIDHGKIFFNGKDVTNINSKELRSYRKKVQIVFQDPYSSLNPKLTIKSSLMDGVKQANVEKSKRIERIMELLELVGLPRDFIYKYPHQFSGGQRQRICIARALSLNPELIVCDEPVSALDVSVQAQIINLLMELKEKIGLSLIFITHDLNLVGYFCDYVYVMYMGKVVECAPAIDLFKNPLHPYTKLLLSSIPGRRKNNNETMIPANWNSQKKTPCAFAPRCRYFSKRCEDKIYLKKIEHNHFVRCVNL